MSLDPDDVFRLKSQRIQLEVGLIYLRRKRADTEKQLNILQGQRKKAESERGASDVNTVRKLAKLEGDLRALGIEIGEREAAIKQISNMIDETSDDSELQMIDEMRRENDNLARELAQTRGEMLDALRALADPLRRYGELVERKQRIVQKLSSASERDLKYQNYLDCALLRQNEYDDGLRFVVEELKRARVVA